MVWDLPDVAGGTPSFGVGLSLRVWPALVRIEIGTWWVRVATFFSPWLCGSLSLGVTNWFAFFLPPFRVLLWLFFCYFQGFYFCLLFGCAGSWLLLRLSLVESGRFLTSCGAWASLRGGFSRCGLRALGRACFSSCSSWAQQCCIGLVSPWLVWSSRTRDQTRVSCIGRQILIHWTTREVL